MEEKSVEIPAIKSGHCVLTITREVSPLEGVEEVAPSADGKKMTFRWKPPATWEKIRAKLVEIDFPPAE
jgi:copper chaperone CopZ